VHLKHGLIADIHRLFTSFNQLIICCYFSVQQESIQDKLKSQKEEEANIQHEIDAYDKELKLFATKRNTLMTRIEECNENICKLGPLPLQEQTKYQNVGTVRVSMLCNFEIKVGVCWSQIALVQLKWYNIKKRKPD
jgi:hypothetical protein